MAVIWEKRVKRSAVPFAEKQTVKLMLHRLQRIERFCLWCLCLVAVLIGLFSYYWQLRCPTLCTMPNAGFIGAVTLSLAAFMAAGLIGALLGFLFGIPKSFSSKGSEAQAASRPETAQSSPILRTNTSIEDISSTLSTMLIGASLTQFSQVMDTTYRMSLFLAYQLVGKEVEPGHNIPDIDTYVSYLPSPYFFSLIVIAFVLGIFFAYIETRTRLTIFLIDNESLPYTAGGSVAEADESLIDPDKPTPPEFKLVESPDPAQPQTGTRQPLKPLRATEEDVQRAQSPEPQSPDDKVKWAVAKAKLGDYMSANATLESVQSILPTSNTVISLISDVQSLASNASGAIDVLQNALSDKNRTNRRPLYRKLKQSLLNALYEPEGFDTAIKASDALIADGESSALDYVRRACAFGQKYSYLLKHNASEDELALAADGVRAALEKVVDLKPSGHYTRELVQQLLEASPSDADNDLVKVRERPEIRDNLERYLS